MKKFVGFILVISALLFLGVIFIFPRETENLAEITGEDANPNLVLVPLEDRIYHAMSPSVFTGRERRSDLKLIEEAVGVADKELAWVSISNTWFPRGRKNECEGGSRYILDQGIHFPKKDVEDALRAGQIPSIRMLPYDRCISLDDEHYKMQNFIDGKFDKELRIWARELKKIPSPVLLTFGVEVNGYWFPWNALYNGGNEKGGYGDPNLYDGHERFRDAYRHIIDIFREEGVENATWVYHVNCIWPSDLDKPEASVDGYYPGDDYIDWIGISCYGSQDADNPYWWPMSETFNRSYDLLANSPLIGKDKPIALMEYGVTEEPRKAKWLRDFFSDVQANRYPRIKAMSWWQSDFCIEYNHHLVGGCNRMTEIKVNSNPESLRVYREFFADDKFTGKAVFEPRQ